MNRIDRTLKAVAASGKKILSPYLTAGDFEEGLTVKLLHALVEGGADILELGIPFSDPMAEGPVIQEAMQRSLANGMTLEGVFSIVEQFRRQDSVTPLVLMGYVNPIFQYGYEAFAKRATATGVDGLIVVDLPPEEGEEFFNHCEAHSLYNIFLCSPTTTKERMKLIISKARGYLYYVSLKGVTGSNTFDLRQVQTQYKRHKAQTNLPMMIGFGIKTAQIAGIVASFADGVIVGAALIEHIYKTYLEKGDSIKAGRDFVKCLRGAMDTQEQYHD